MSQARCACVVLAFSWSQNLGWAQRLYLALIQSLSGSEVLQEGEQFCLVLNCYFLLTCQIQCQICYILYILQIRQSNSAKIDKPNRRCNSISNGKHPNIILLGNW